jgi:enoyl-CoA hydratase/carnithine racemase
MTTDTPTAELEAVAGLRVIHLKRPPVNALDHELLERLLDIVADLERDAGCRAVLIQSDLDAFVAGADIGMLESGSGDLELFRNRVQELFDRIERLTRPVVVAIGGHAVGGGLELVLACDIRILSDRPGLRLGFPEVRLGLLPGAGGTQRLSRLLGKTRTLELLLMGRTFDAAAALEWGLVTEIVPAADVTSRARAVAEELADGPTEAYAAIKQCVLHATHHDLDSGLELERLLAAQLMQTADAREGLRAFLERRTPTFTGK